MSNYTSTTFSPVFIRLHTLYGNQIALRVNKIVSVLQPTNSSSGTSIWVEGEDEPYKVQQTWEKVMELICPGNEIFRDENVGTDISKLVREEDAEDFLEE